MSSLFRISDRDVDTAPFIAVGSYQQEQSGNARTLTKARMTFRVSSDTLPAEASMTAFPKRASPWWSPNPRFPPSVLLR
jgi:hypothetical protein